MVVAVVVVLVEVIAVELVAVVVVVVVVVVEVIAVELVAVVVGTVRVMTAVIEATAEITHIHLECILFKNQVPMSATLFPLYRIFNDFIDLLGQITWNTPSLPNEVI